MAIRGWWRHGQWSEIEWVCGAGRCVITWHPAVTLNQFHHGPLIIKGKRNPFVTHKKPGKHAHTPTQTHPCTCAHAQVSGSLHSRSHSQWLAIMEFFHVTPSKCYINNRKTFILSPEGFCVTMTRCQLWVRTPVQNRFVLPADGGVSGIQLNREVVGLNRCLVAEPFVCFPPSGYCTEGGHQQRWLLSLRAGPDRRTPVQASGPVWGKLALLSQW